MEEHTHTEECYDEDNNLTCDLSEHTHDETCLLEPTATPEPTATVEPTATPEPIYFCGMEEHTHTEECYDEDNNLICEKLEHTHDETCLLEPTATPEPVYYCGMEEHTHTEECYDEDNNLICEKPEHTHDETCLIEPFAVTLTSDGLLLPSGAELAPVTVLAEISGGTAPYALELQVRLEEAIVHEESVEAETAGEQSFSFMPESLGV